MYSHEWTRYGVAWCVCVCVRRYGYVMLDKDVIQFFKKTDVKYNLPLGADLFKGDLEGY